MTTGQRSGFRMWRTRAACALALLLSLTNQAGAQFATAGAASTTTVKVEGVSSCTTTLGSGTFGVAAWAWGENQSVTTGVGRVSFHDLSITKSLDACSPALALATARGNRYTRITLTQYDKNSNVLVTVLVENALVSSYVINGSQISESPTESISFSFAKITVTHASGSKFTFDTTTNTGN